ncbi:hypothetical protein [Vibrio barjaei]|uniref:hypothetical protein n=1 Tax=Vibrio barjaei TaxID=1676683 RepID=UPI002284C7F9|nr:hypothetical protein [Vibrio barjaei]MCY9870479.1 hypothetical protein [Vibrio barjaei]
MAKEITHNDLCKKAVGWLKRSHSAGGCGCPNAFSEVQSGSNGGEIVDAIGLRTAYGTETIVIEAKVSRSDFLADRNKPFRANPELGMGNFRYYICPEGLISESELPNKWGLLYVGLRGKITVVRGHKLGKSSDWKFECNRDAELGMASLLLAKSGNFEQLNDVFRYNQRLEKKVKELEAKVHELEFPNKMEQMIKGLDDLAASQKPIPRASR